MFRFLLLLLLGLATFVPGRGQDCPRIWRSGDTLYTDPAAQIQWFRGDTPLAGENRSWLLPPRSEQALYRVEVRGGFSPSFSFEVSASDTYELAGFVFDADQRPVSGASVRRGSATTTTDAAGRFVLRVNERRPAAQTPVLLVVEKAGYWRNTTRQYLSRFDRTETLVRLQPQTVTNRVDARTGGEMGFNGFALRLPPNGVQTASGQPYTGTILLSVEGALPTDPDFGLRMPGGDFTGIDSQGNEVRLYSFGYLSVIMRTESGERLNLRPGFEANLRFHLSTAQAHRAPDSVPAWHFDDASGTWEQDGWCYRKGNTLSGSVRNFSSWNVGLPLPGQSAGRVRGRLLDCANRPLGGAWVRIGQRQVVTDSLGSFWAWMPNDLPFDVITQYDTLTNQLVAAAQELTLPDLRGSNFGGLARWDARADVLEVELWGAIPAGGRLSVDGGQTWTGNRRFLNLTAPPAQVLLDSSCRFPLRVVVPHQASDCQRIELVRLEDSPILDNLTDAWAAPQALRLHLAGPQFGNRWDLVLPLTCLHDLAINQANLTEVPERINELSVLGRLSLAGNILSTLPQNLWTLTELQELYLDTNQISSLPAEIDQLTSLKLLSLDHNNLSALPTSIVRLDSLESVRLNSNQFSVFPPEILGLQRLRHLYVEDNQLTSLPVGLGQLNLLDELILNGNQIQSLPADLVEATRLEHLELNYNRLTALPSAIGDLSNLLYLRIEHNQITELPASITALSNLLNLEAENNQLTELPANIGNLGSLLYLRLNRNNLTALPASIGDLTNLTELYLNNNQLTGLPPEIQNLASNLIKLELKGNPIPVQERAAIEALLPTTDIIWE